MTLKAIRFQTDGTLHLIEAESLLKLLRYGVRLRESAYRGVEKHASIVHYNRNPWIKFRNVGEIGRT
jgi:hypothetical protein